MSLMGTLAKMAIGYAAARGVDRLSQGGGLSGLLGGQASMPATTPQAQAQGQMAGMMGGMSGAGNPLAEMMQKFQSGQMDLSSMMGGLGGAGGGLAGMLAAMGGAAAAGGGKLAGQVADQMAALAPNPEAERMAGLMLRAMIMAAKADGEIDKAEQAKILETVGKDASDEDMAFVRAALDAPVDAETLAADTPQALRAQVYTASLMTIRVDTQAEAAYLDALARAMEFDQATTNMLHAQMGLPPLYR